MPKILKTYESEIRVLQEKNKMLRKTLRDITEQLKLKEDELLYVREQLKHLTALTKDRNLKEREKLTDEVQELKQKLQKSEEEISLLNRKLILESKNSKHKLNMEMTRNRQCRKELNEALTEISRLTSALEVINDFLTLFSYTYILIFIVVEIVSVLILRALVNLKR